MYFSICQRAHRGAVVLRPHRPRQLALKFDSLPQLFQIGFELFDGLIALINILAQSFQNYPLEFGGCVWREAYERRRIVLRNRDDHICLGLARDRKSTRLNSSHSQNSYAVFCLKKKKKETEQVSI